MERKEAHLHTWVPAFAGKTMRWVPVFAGTTVWWIPFFARDDGCVVPLVLPRLQRKAVHPHPLYLGDGAGYVT